MKITVSPWFFFTAALIGYINSNSLLELPLWIGIIFVSIFVHEMGHALFGRIFNRKVHVQFVAFGGVTQFHGKPLQGIREFFTILAGPVFGFSLFALSEWTLQSGVTSYPLFIYTLQRLALVNLFWNVINLIPILPLDGGQLVRVIMCAYMGNRGIKASALISSVCSGALAVIALMFHQLFLAVLFGFFFFQNLQLYKTMRLFSSSDENVRYQKEINELREAFLHGEDTSLENRIKEFRKVTKKGQIHNEASMLLAQYYMQHNKVHEAYILLVGMLDSLSIKMKEELSKLAYKVGDFSLVIKLSAECYDFSPSVDIASRAALSSGYLSEEQQAIGWIKAAKERGLEDVSSLIRNKAFDSIRMNKRFRYFLDAL